jgi:hypothetical protein
MDPYDAPELLQLPLDACVLKMLQMDIGSVSVRRTLRLHMSVKRLLSCAGRAFALHGSS